jgi:hypothetical protein
MPRLYSPTGITTLYDLDWSWTSNEVFSFSPSFHALCLSSTIEAVSRGSKKWKCGRSRPIHQKRDQERYHRQGASRSLSAVSVVSTSPHWHMRNRKPVGRSTAHIVWTVNDMTKELPIYNSTVHAEVSWVFICCICTRICRCPL